MTDEGCSSDFEKGEEEKACRNGRVLQAFAHRMRRESFMGTLLD
jgi:hypothetical protein